MTQPTTSVTPPLDFMGWIREHEAELKPPVNNQFTDVYELVEREQRRVDPPAPPAKDKKE